MPLSDFNAAEYNDWYQVFDHATQRWLHYEREAFEKNLLWGTAEPAMFAEAFSLVKGQKVLIVGGGFGFLAEKLVELGYGPLLCVDTSAWIQSNKGVHARITVMNADANTTVGRKDIRAFFGIGNNAKVDIAITEDVLTCLTDAEITQFLPNLRGLATRVGHLVSPGHSNPSRYNYKTLEAWKALVTPDTVVYRDGYYSKL